MVAGGGGGIRWIFVSWDRAQAIGSIVGKQDDSAKFQLFVGTYGIGFKNVFAHMLIQSDHSLLFFFFPESSKRIKQSCFFK